MKYLLFLITLACISTSQLHSKILFEVDDFETIAAKQPIEDHTKLFKEWKILKIKGVEQISSSPTMTFEKEESKVTGFAGCNNYFSTYTISGNNLSFGPAGATRKLCPDMTVEDAFLILLPKVARYEIIKKELYLYDQSDELLILAVSY